MQKAQEKDIKSKANKMKQRISVGALIVAAVAVVCANFALTVRDIPKTEEVAAEEEQNAFAVFRQEREDIREKELTYIESVIASAEASQTVRDEAQQQKLALAKTMEHELSCEGIIMSKMGYDTVVSMSDGNVSVVVDAAELEETEVLQIADIITGATGAKAQNIKVMPRV